MLDNGIQAPTFESVDQHGVTHTLEQYRGKWVLLYFYPQDDTVGCTKEACGLRDVYHTLQEKMVVMGVSPDNTESHKKFADKYSLPFILLADIHKDIITAYEAQGIMTKRISYLINPQGIIAKTYPKVNPSMHAQEIMHDIKHLEK